MEKKWWSETEETTLLAKHRESVLTAFRRAEKLPRPKLGEMFNDVWAVRKGEEAPRVIVRPHTSRADGRWNRKQNWAGC